MIVETCSNWDETFFQKMIDFKNYVHQNIPTSFPEKLSDYERFFSDSSPFKVDYLWEAIMVSRNSTVIAKAILCWRRDGLVGNLGFIDWLNDKEGAHALIFSATKIAKKNNLTNIKTPIDLNLFIKYRIKLPGGGAPFWGEPIYPDYYHDLFKETGFSEIAKWDTYELKKWDGIRDYLLKRVKLNKRQDVIHSRNVDESLRTQIRCVNMKSWDHELAVIHKLFNKAYESMPEWEPVTFEQFKIIYDDFKYIINPFYSYIVELSNTPVGFSINFADPLSILLKVKDKNLSKMDKIILFLKLRSNFSTFLIAHVGKIPGPNGEEIKGVQIQVSKRIQYIVTLMKKTLVTFQVKNSPSRRSFEEKSQRPYSQYVLYGMDLK